MCTCLQFIAKAHLHRPNIEKVVYRNSNAEAKRIRVESTQLAQYRQLNTRRPPTHFQYGGLEYGNSQSTESDEAMTERTEMITSKTKSFLLTANCDRPSINGTNGCWINSVLAVLYNDTTLKTRLWENHLTKKEDHQMVHDLLVQPWGDPLYKWFYNLMKSAPTLDQWGGSADRPSNAYGTYGDAGLVLRFFRYAVFKDESVMEFAAHMRIRSITDLQTWVGGKSELLGLIKATAHLQQDYNGPMGAQVHHMIHSISHWVTFLPQENRTHFHLFDALLGGIQEDRLYTLEDIFNHCRRPTEPSGPGQHPYFILFRPNASDHDQGHGPTDSDMTENKNDNVIHDVQDTRRNGINSSHSSTFLNEQTPVSDVVTSDTVLSDA